MGVPPIVMTVDVALAIVVEVIAGEAGIQFMTGYHFRGWVTFYST